MSVWISDEKLLIFVSLISPSKMILFEKKYQAFDTVFHFWYITWKPRVQKPITLRYRL